MKVVVSVFKIDHEQFTLVHTKNRSPFVTKLCTPDYLDIRSRKMNVSGNDSDLVVDVSHTDPFAGGSYGGDDVWVTEKDHHRLVF